MRKPKQESFIEKRIREKKESLEFFSYFVDDAKAYLDETGFVSLVDNLTNEQKETIKEHYTIRAKFYRKEPKTIENDLKERNKALLEYWDKHQKKELKNVTYWKLQRSLIGGLARIIKGKETEELKDRIYTKSLDEYHRCCVAKNPDWHLDNMNLGKAAKLTHKQKFDFMRSLTVEESERLAPTIKKVYFGILERIKKDFNCHPVCKCDMGYCHFDDFHDIDEVYHLLEDMKEYNNYKITRQEEKYLKVVQAFSREKRARQHIKFMKEQANKPSPPDNKTYTYEELFPFDEMSDSNRYL